MVLPGMYPDYDEQQRLEEEAKRMETTTQQLIRPTILYLRIVRVEKIKPPPMEVIRVEYPFIYNFMNMFSFGCKISVKFWILILPFSLTLF